MNGKENYMLSKFICPVALLPEFEILLKNNAPGHSKIAVSAISSGGNTIADFNSNFENDLNIWKEFELNKNNGTIVNSYEAKLPSELFAQNLKEISAFIDSVSDKIKSNISEPVNIFFECDMNPESNTAANYLINAIETHNLNDFNSGFKLRTGGIEAAAFPSPESVAFCIRECLDRKAPMKFTAGLHHPFRHFDKGIGTMMHGFINVFGAGIIAMRHDISDSGLIEILNDEDPSDFAFTDECFSWKGWKIEIADIEYARKNLVLSYGSCSFDEPVDDLKSFNLI